MGIYKLVVNNNKKIGVFEANWLETGSFGTSDIASWVSAANGRGVGKDFVAYMAPPGRVSSVFPACAKDVNKDGAQDCCSGDCKLAYRSELYVAADRYDSVVHVWDTATNGTLYNKTITIPANKYWIFTLSCSSGTASACTIWNSLTTSGRRPYLRISASQPVSVVSSNHNDNWLAFASGAGLPALEVGLNGGGEVNCGAGNATFTMTVSNPSAVNAVNVKANVAIGTGLVYGSTSGPLGQPTVAGQSLTWTIPTLSAGATLTQSVTLAQGCSALTVCFNGTNRLPEVRAKAWCLSPWDATKTISDETAINYTLLDQTRPNVISVVPTAQQVGIPAQSLLGLSTSTNYLYSVKETTGVLTPMAPLSFADGNPTKPVLEGCAWTPDGRLMAIDQSQYKSRLVSIDPKTGKITYVSDIIPTGNGGIIGNPLFYSLAAHPDGYLYAALDTSLDGSYPEVVKIDPINGLITEGLNFSPAFGPNSGLTFKRNDEMGSYYCSPPPVITNSGMLSFSSSFTMSDTDGDDFSETFKFSDNKGFGVDVPIYDPLRNIVGSLVITVADLKIVKNATATTFDFAQTVIPQAVTVSDPNSGLVVLKLDLALDGGYLRLDGNYGYILAHVKNPVVVNPMNSVLLEYFRRQPVDWPTPLVATFQASTMLVDRVRAGDTLATTISTTIKAEGTASAAAPVCGNNF